MPSNPLKLKISGASFDFNADISGETASKLMAMVASLMNHQPIDVLVQPASVQPVQPIIAESPAVESQSPTKPTGRAHFYFRGGQNLQRLEAAFDRVMLAKGCSTVGEIKRSYEKEYGRGIDSLGGWFHRTILRLASNRGYIIEGKYPTVIRKPEFAVGDMPRALVARKSRFNSKLKAAFRKVRQGGEIPPSINQLSIKVASLMGRKHFSLSGSEWRVLRKLCTSSGISFAVSRNFHARKQPAESATPVTKKTRRQRKAERNERIASLFDHVMAGKDYILGTGEFKDVSVRFHPLTFNASARHAIFDVARQKGFMVEGVKPVRIYKPAARDAIMKAYKDFKNKQGVHKKPIKSVEPAQQPAQTLHLVLPAQQPVQPVQPAQPQTFNIDAKVEAAVMMVVRSTPHFTVFDVMRVLGEKCTNSSNPMYYSVYCALGGLVRRNMLDKFVQDDRGMKKTYYSMRGAAPKPEKPVSEDELPDDTTDECIKAIIEHNDVSFNWQAICKERNVHGAYYDKFSAKGLFDWMFRHTGYVSDLTCKVVEAKGTGDYRYIKVGA